MSGRILRLQGGDTVGASGTRVVLHRVGTDTQGSLDSTRAGPDGAFRIRLRRDTVALFLVSARHGGIEFFSAPFTFETSGSPEPVVLLVSDTSSAAPVEIGGRFLVIGAPGTERTRTVVDLIILRNAGERTRVAPDTATPTWRAALPPAAGYRVAERGSEISPLAVRIAADTVLVFAPLSPGEKQLLLEYTLPAEWTSWWVPLGEGRFPVQVVSEEAGASVAGPGLSAADPQVVDGRALDRWSGTVDGGGVLRVTFPGATGASERKITMVLAGIMAVALVVLAWVGLRRGRPTGRGAAAVLLVAGLARCAGPAGSGAITVVDDVGDTVSLARPAGRVVSLIPAATEVLFALGAGETVVGRTTWCDYPPAAAGVPVVGGGLDPNVEAVVAAGPDLVVLYPSPATANAAATLARMGIPAVQLRTDGLADLGRAIHLLGALTGRPDSAAALLGRTAADLEAATRPHRGGARLLVLAWDRPPIALGRASFLHEVVERAGATNVFSDLDAPSAPVGIEAIAARDPDAVLVQGDVPGFTGRPEWQVVRAVRERRFVRVTGTEFQRPTPRAADAVRQLAAVLDTLGRP